MKATVADAAPPLCALGLFAKVADVAVKIQYDTAIRAKDVSHITRRPNFKVENAEMIEVHSVMHEMERLIWF